MMKYLKKPFSLCLVLALCLSLGTVALAAPVADATIDTSRTGSLDIYKYDFTNAAKDGVWDSSYVSTGVYDQAVNDTLATPFGPVIPTIPATWVTATPPMAMPFVG